jgi:hypothetical protein
MVSYKKLLQQEILIYTNSTGHHLPILMTSRSTCQIGTSLTLGQNSKNYPSLAVSRTLVSPTLLSRTWRSCSPIHGSRPPLLSIRSSCTPTTLRKLPYPQKYTESLTCLSPKLLDYCKQKGIHATAYSCLGSTDSPLYKNEKLKKLADNKGKSVQQCLLMWGLQRGSSVIPKSVTASRIQGNFQLDGWELTAEEMKEIDSLPERFKVCGDAWLPIKVFFGDDE